MIRKLAMATLVTPTISECTELMEMSGQTNIFEGIENTPPNIARMPDLSNTSQEPFGTRKKAMPN